MAKFGVTTVLVAALALGCSEREKVEFESPRGTISYLERVRPDKGELLVGVRPATQEELGRLRKSAAGAEAFIARHVPLSGRQDDLLANLDLAFAAWLHSPDGHKESAAEVESVVGSALGEYCIQRLPVRWAVNQQKGESEFALVGDDPPSISHPLASVRYRIEDRKTEFVGALYEALVKMRKKAAGNA